MVRARGVLALAGHLRCRGKIHSVTWSVNLTGNNFVLTYLHTQAMAGHPPDISDYQDALIRQRRADGASLRAIAKELGIHHSTVEQHCKDVRPLEPADRYAELVELLKEKIEANFFKDTAAAE